MNDKQLRYNYIDVIKGILILLVVAHHIFGLMRSYEIIPNDFEYLEKLYVPFFMPAFFVVTGFCSNFNKPKELFLKTELKRLLIPAVVFYIIISFGIMVIDSTLTMHNALVSAAKLVIKGGSWFLTALLVAKIIYYFVVNKEFTNKHCIIIVGLGLLIASVASWLQVFEVWYIWHAMGLLIFLLAGQIIKDTVITLKMFIISLVVYSVYVFFLIRFNLHLPRITSTLSLYPWEIIHFLVGAVSGTIVVWYICEKISKNKLLEFFGKNSLVVFVTHWIILKAIICLSVKYSISITQTPVIFFAILFIVICAICTALVKLINTKYLRWMIGKI